MTYVIKLLFFLLREGFFDHPDEYNPKSRKFNARKSIIMAVTLTLLVTNMLALYRIFTMADEILTIKQTEAVLCQRRIDEIEATCRQRLSP